VCSLTNPGKWSALADVDRCRVLSLKELLKRYTLLASLPIPHRHQVAAGSFVRDTLFIIVSDMVSDRRDSDNYELPTTLPLWCSIAKSYLMLHKTVVRPPDDGAGPGQSGPLQSLSLM
jgi:hypothetical protein